MYLFLLFLFLSTRFKYLQSYYYKSIYITFYLYSVIIILLFSSFSQFFFLGLLFLIVCLVEH